MCTSFMCLVAYQGLQEIELHTAHYFLGSVSSVIVVSNLCFHVVVMVVEEN